VEGVRVGGGNFDAAEDAVTVLAVRPIDDPGPVELAREAWTSLAVETFAMIASAE
jgi:hypothetical protein